MAVSCHSGWHRLGSEQSGLGQKGMVLAVTGNQMFAQVPVSV